MGSDEQMIRSEHAIALLIPVTYLLMLGLERVKPNRLWPSIRHWQLTGIGFFVMLGLVNNIVAILARKCLPDVRLFDTASLGTVAGTLIGFLALSLGNALIHRAYHRYEFLWRYVHRFHHAPQRLDVAGVMYQTPWEAMASAMLFVFVTVFLLGLDPVASMLCAYLAAFYGMFQHLNIRTPVWTGYLIQRPEAHCLHHERGKHADNYSDFPIWDMLWGTFRNPVKFDGELGFASADLDRQWPFWPDQDANSEQANARR